MSQRILFQGDSITDCGRNRENGTDMGKGYPCFIKASLGMDRPEEFEFLNRGISGNRIVDLYARIKIDLINLAPDYLSILIGVNDTWHEIARENGVDTEKFEMVYRWLLEEVIAACPDIRIILLAPFVLPGSATESTDEKPARWEFFQRDVAEKAAVTEKLAEEFGAECILLQPAFDEACKRAPADYWTRDGVHPTPCGHELIKRLWLQAFEKMQNA